MKPIEPTHLKNKRKLPKEFFEKIEERKPKNKKIKIGRSLVTTNESLAPSFIHFITLPTIINNNPR
jgi:hypothetical protein